MAPSSLAEEAIAAGSAREQLLADLLTGAFRDLVDAKQQLAIYRELAKLGIERLAGQHKEIASLQRQLSHLREELRSTRGTRGLRVAA